MFDQKAPYAQEADMGFLSKHGKFQTPAKSGGLVVLIPPRSKPFKRSLIYWVKRRAHQDRPIFVLVVGYGFMIEALMMVESEGLAEKKA